MADASMYQFFRDRYYTAVATLENAYPDMLKTDPVLAAAAVQIKVAELAIAGRMEEIADTESDDE